MASSSGVPKRAWKLQEFVAHGASVNCVSLGHKSGRVLVTGGDDKKVNLWAVGKPNCIMSLCGHTTPIECVRFGQTEELVVAGSASGALKIWDLEAARLIRTLTGHKAGLTCTDFHPYGDFLASGSADKNLKLWDIRRKGCIFTYKGHANRVNSLRFSPDGQWIASAGEDAAVKVWDLRAGKMMAEFNDHGGPVHDVEFHPHEFLLASASQDRTVSFWDLETFSKLSSSEKDTGPVRCLSFHPEGNVLFSASHDSLKIHRWEPSVGIYDHISMGWGKVRDMAVAATQLIGVAYNSSNVSVYVVDLKRTQPFLGGCLSRSTDASSNLGQPRTDQIPSSTIIAAGLADSASPEPHLVTSSSLSQRGKPGQTMRKSFVKEKPGPNGQRPSPQVKISEEHTSSTDPEDSSGEINQTDINDVHNYENIFKPRRNDLNRTPEPKDDFEYELFQPPLSGSESDNNLSRPSDLRLRNVSTQGTKKPSPSPSRRISQPNPPAPGYGGSPVRARRGSNPATPTGCTYKPIHEAPSNNSSVALANPSDRSSGHQALSNNTSVTPTRQESPQVMSQGQVQLRSAHQPGIPARSSSLNRTAAGPNTAPCNIPSQLQSDTSAEFAVPLNPISRIHFGQQERSLSTPSPSEAYPVLEQQRPLDRPTLVKQPRTSVHIQPEIGDVPVSQPTNYAGEGLHLDSPPVHDISNVAPMRLARQLPNQSLSEMEANQHSDYNLQEQQQAFYQQQMLHAPSNQPQAAQHQPPPMPVVVNHAPTPMITPNRRMSQTRNSNRNQSSVHTQHRVSTTQYHTTNDGSGIQTMHIPPSSPEKKVAHEVVPMNADKPTGLQLDEFLPRKFSGLGFNYNTKETGGSKFSAYKDYGGRGEDMSESEVTSSILKGHDAMMTVLTTRGRNMEIIQKIWQGKDAKAAVDQAVSLNDQAIMVDFLSVITLRPSIWNLDLCESLLPVIGELLQTKYEMYIQVGCGAMKLILKNFASVIKSNIDSPIQTVGVDISREERHRKCMQCYSHLVKTRALIIKRQSMQGKLGHSMRELAILMQYID